MLFSIASVTVEIKFNSLWLEAGKTSLHVTGNKFYWKPITERYKTDRESSVVGNWLGLSFAGSRIV